MQDESLQNAQGKSILLIEDDRATGLFTNRLLSKVGQFTVAFANNYIEAIKMTAENYYSLIIADQRVPDIDGLSFAISLRSGKLQVQRLLTSLIPNSELKILLGGISAEKEQEWKRIPIVLYSARLSDDILEKIIEYNIILIAKDGDIEAFLKTIQAIISNSPQQAL